MDNITMFSDDATESFVEMEWYDKTCWINKHYVDPDNCKLFMLLLKSGFKKMQEKRCITYQQLICSYDWEAFAKENKEWTIITKNSDNTLLIECPIVLAADLIVDGFLRNNAN